MLYANDLRRNQTPVSPLQDDPAKPKVYTIPASLPFVDSLASGIRAQVGDTPDALSAATILLPTRRACRALRDAFLRNSGGTPVLLPRLLPLGDLDEDELLIGASGLMGTDAGFGGEAVMSIPPAIPGMRRQLLLTRLILAQPNTATTPDQAARLAHELARLLDQVHTERSNFDRLQDLVPEDFASHWQMTLDFLRVITDVWPDLLAAEGSLDPADRRNRLLETRARLWSKTPPRDIVIAAGSTGSIPATANLLSVIARLPRGGVILPGLDLATEEAIWQLLGPPHPQFGMAQLLKQMGVSREEVAHWPGLSAKPATSREQLVNAALTPASTPPSAPSSLSLDDALDGIHRIDCPGPREEATAIALTMREALETPGRTAALVTPDRSLARRVTAELKRWRIGVDDSAGLPLAQTPTGAFLRLTADAVAEDLAPIAVLALLKHPLAAAGYAPDMLRRLARRLETSILRGPRPSPGIAGLLDALPEGEPDLKVFVERLSEALNPMLALPPDEELPLVAITRRLVNCAEALAATDRISGRERLWAGEAGEQAARFIAEILEWGDAVDVSLIRFAAFFETLMGGRVVRPRYGAHPRLAIWGPLEARLQSADLLILGGLNEGTWPAETPASPWMSRPMTAELGLPLPERRVGLSAHDFVQGLNARAVMLTRAERVDGTPTVPCRWLRRIDNLLARHGWATGLARGTPWLGWVEAMDRPAATVNVTAPRPTPPAEARPTHLSVTQVESLIRDPYAIYARHILGLRPLDPIDADPGAADRGTIIHGVLDEFITAHPKNLPPNAEQALLDIGRQHFDAHMSRPGIRAFWWPRFQRIAAWFIDNERRRRDAGWRTVATEAEGVRIFDGLQTSFTLKARADRIDAQPDVGLDIIDYKTGQPPTDKQVAAGLTPQLPLEAAIANSGGFAAARGYTVANLTYIRLSGGRYPGQERVVKLDLETTVADAVNGLTRLIHKYEDPNTPYLSQPRPMFADRFGDYDHLARLREWYGRRGKS